MTHQVVYMIQIYHIFIIFYQWPHHMMEVVAVLLQAPELKNQAVDPWVWADLQTSSLVDFLAD